MNCNLNWTQIVVIRILEHFNQCQIWFCQLWKDHHSLLTSSIKNKHLTDQTTLVQQNIADIIPHRWVVCMYYIYCICINMCKHTHIIMILLWFFLYYLYNYLIQFSISFLNSPSSTLYISFSFSFSFPVSPRISSNF